ncbi:MAG: Hydrolase, NUDIX family [Candidatus Roizmanbacteria bacterium GW2011_GWC2_37_13]|uniref:Hydrolase, NUDIX family n=1 Tax=Candidatus Roizmanbacteria bacterium GW2011_GWC2_37_13 TaxID=1618486 RepID=A0A0G0JCI4_9BACT|nr:MAG: Hydrolase, NUDIX family [Candidatus Roizmanbacteria bacterium GW2011_GWC1_37_12]KKQ25881.1 MAG: Hydrolase, NUDIX family [Candidatus Roizmanbacteria bacterium GW2011_GWC2_37_13]
MINCTFENGNKALLRHITIGAIVINKEKTKILLGKRSMKISNGGKYNLLGGFLGRDETTEQAVLREIKEESGYSGKIISLFRVNDSPYRAQEDRQNVDFAFIVEAQETIGKEDWESTEIKWFDLNNLPAKEQFAFDHRETIDLFLKFLNTPFPLLIIHI